jgi:simple sugar transport system ATP-binding protein
LTDGNASVALRLEGIEKRFGEVTAIRRGDLEVRCGELHAVVGENGAGKSTLLGVAAGIVPRDAGGLWTLGKREDAYDARRARHRGVEMVQQHFALFEDLTVLENMFLGSEVVVRGGRIDVVAEARRAREALRELDVELPLEAKLRDLGVGDHQRVEIARAICRDARVLILDEPTAILTPGEADALYATLRRLVAKGVAVVVVTHKLDEVQAHADRVTVMRRGETLATRSVTKGDDLGRLAGELIAGTTLPPLDLKARTPGRTLLRVRDLVVGRALRGLSLEVKAGEIVGVAGVLGNGQSELVLVLGGLLAPDSGDVDAGRVAVVHEDRRTSGLVLDASVEENLVLGELARFTRAGLVDDAAVRARVTELIARYDVRPPDPLARARSLSGGNQQKIVMARALADDPEVLVVAHPTRGVDLLASRAIHSQIVAAAARGAAVLLIGADLTELRLLSDRILVMARGTIVASVPAETDDATLGALMLGARPAVSA